jgi:hypothetical protein
MADPVCASPCAQLADWLRPQPEFDQAADGFGARYFVGGRPMLNLINEGLRQACADKRVFARRRTTAFLFWVHLN